MALTGLQHRFVQRMVADPHVTATEAYVRAGGRSRGHAAEATASRMLRNAEVAAAIEAGRRRAMERAGLSAERTLTEVARLAYADPRALFHADGRPKAPHEWDEATAAVVAGLDVDEEIRPGRKGKAVKVRTTKVKQWSKTEALRLAADLQGLVKQRHEHSGPAGGPIPVSLPVDPSRLTDDQLHQLKALLDTAAGVEPGGRPAIG